MRKSGYASLTRMNRLQIKWPTILGRLPEKTCVCRHKLDAQVDDVIHSYKGHEVVSYAIHGQSCEACGVFYPNLEDTDRINDSLYFLYKGVAGYLPTEKGRDPN